MPFFKKKKESEEVEDVLAGIDTSNMTEQEMEAAREAAIAESVRQKFDKESKYRNKLPTSIQHFIGVLLVSFALFQLYTSIFTIQARQLRPIHLGIAMALVFLLYPQTRPSDATESSGTIGFWQQLP
jgi:Fe2+ transport system protein B